MKISEKIIKNIPNMLTTLNLFAGLAAISILIRGEIASMEKIVLALIVFGSIIDFLDGFAARKLNASSDFGKQLDSFADLTTFGIAPVCFVLFAACEFNLSIALSCAVFVMAGIFRLARYNIGDFSQSFIGLPITAAGIILTLYAATRNLWASCSTSLAYTLITTAIMFALSVAMVSKVEVKRICK